MKVLRTGGPMIVGTMTTFYMLRTYLERSNPGTFADSSLGLLVPLTLASVPAIGYAVAKRAVPPEAAVAGIAYSAGVHLLDRTGATTRGIPGFIGKPY
eukprot:CAMPEP_0185589734 /NCGR_PEP_ID=MMETSP0434-20130131/58190_1 /TAXON_ID=626734 ORGANISM="Favella taraikaensis, Strain Fe Narragansett Bay" /NCGR_SAMPLE_ID=MMETSP0434 /ASSEMBLY_ACC=CAM_ASM_000379 /LENGTH=97 /DNA_ID=CAMNT_0028213395 /DNA_START=140 /DNA_END=433 /DNA_ORIENTATION=-